MKASCILALVFLLFSSPIKAQTKIESTQEFRTAAKAAWETSMYGRFPIESAFAVDNNGKISALVSNRIEQNEVAHVSLNIDSLTCVGVFHTHPDQDSVGRTLNARPSPHDIAEAKRLHKIVWVSSRMGLFRVNPDGSVEQLFDHGDWFRIAHHA